MSGDLPLLQVTTVVTFSCVALLESWGYQSERAMGPENRSEKNNKNLEWSFDTV